MIDTGTADRRMAQILVERHEIDEAYLPFAFDLQKSSNRWLGDILIVNGLVDERNVYRALSAVHGLQFKEEIAENELDLDTRDMAFLEDMKLIRKYLAVPLTNNRLAVTNPENIGKFIVKYGFRDPVVTSPTILLAAIESAFLKVHEVITNSTHLTQDKLIESANQLLDLVIRRAIMMRASDIHFEFSGDSSCYVRIRVDGDLIPLLSYSERMHEYINNRILMLALGNPSNNQKFDDAAFEYQLSATVQVSMRVSKAPTKLGSTIVLRILRKDQLLKVLDNLGFFPHQATMLRRFIQSPYGMILAAGPTGSGKTTTLYSLLNEIKGTKHKILSIEDPIEVMVPFVEQVEVNKNAGITFDTAIRYFLRRDPDIMMIGEIRDRETAQAAIDAAMTGHIVLSSVHANTAFDVLIRLFDLGITYRKMAGLVGIINQRLVKKHCDCGSRCKKCEAGDGFYGRTVIAEILEVDAELRDFLYKEDVPGFINKAKEKGFKPIEEVAQDYIRAGITVAEQVREHIQV